MDYSGGNTTQLSPDAFQTSIDDYVVEEFQRERQPEYLSAKNEFFFKQMGDTLMVHTWDEFSNVGAFNEVDEQADVLNTDAFLGNTKTKRQKKYMKQIPISFEAFKTDNQNVRAQIGKSVGERARLTQDKDTILETYADAFAGAINTTPDGQAAASNSHATLKGFTIDNLETGAMTPDNLWIQVQSLAGQLGQDGEVGSYMFEGMAMPFSLYRTAKVIMDTDRIPFSAENDENFFDTVYGTVNLKASVFLNSGTGKNPNTNADTSYHLISTSHQWTRNVLTGFSSTLIDPQYTPNDTFVMRSRYMEARMPKSWNGYVGVNGTTA